MRVLVTGGGGFLGRYVVEQLVARGDSVRSFSRTRYAFLDQLGVEQHQGDLRDQAAVLRACESMDVVIHTAAVAGIWGPKAHYFGINAAGTENIVQGCRQQNVGRLVYSSSPSVTFDGSDQCGINESAPYATRWLCHYPASKAAGEQTVLQADDPAGLRTCALRPHLIWGPRDEHLVPRLLARARTGQLRRVGDGTNLVDMIYVENAAQAHLMAADELARAENRVGGRSYFLSQGEPVNCWKWLGEIIAQAGVEPPRRSISFRAAWVVGAMMELTWKLLQRQDEPRMTRFLAAQLATSHYFDIKAARTDFGYAANVDTDEGMRRLANWCATG